ncbi:similar to glucose-6-phosphate/phosphate translocator [Chondrus crispus]|uniref:Similar to glucose-6-phosphate/phosphate translocator n=1 Tax=Chondrus crispus TaxID=2769 RepID=R7QDN5_CHOCR|nr:similar to glucose-6-phosphate/phosphate translocator [Chondrus crispus]CDF35525.1 similar to glucose-6-phosphate/phosphate translocator [Chondrus crispus]|eukprot:XP_005715344.1 similar to glucose-6-phosphate/phosphate translocator [Chondrus crispus]
MLQRARANLAGVDLHVASSMCLNFGSSVSLVVLNKVVMDNHGFKFAATLTFFHLVCTFLLLRLAAALGIFEIKRLPVRDVAKLAAGTMGFITFTNLSLQHNSVGFYQVMKVMTTPTVVIIEALLYQKYLENTLRLSLVPVCLGVIITTVTDFRLNAVGAGYAIAGVIVTSFYQIWSGTLQRSLDCNALQLQAYVAPLAALFILPFVPLLDNWSTNDLESIWYYNFAPNNLSLISVTGFFGFLVNISIFLVIGRSSPLSYNILGHCKTVVVLLSDYVLFHRPFTFKSSFGIILTLIGVFWYTNVKLERARLEKEARERTPAPSISDTKQDILEEEKIELVTSREE